MQSRLARPPVIIIGMHRSGTSIVTRLLAELGLFVGEKQTQNQEALLFFRLNNWLLQQSGGAWDHPEPFHILLQRHEVRSPVEDYIRHVMTTLHIISYLGLYNYLRSRASTLDMPWGWKDPRNTYTLPIWKDVFPGSRVIHVLRHGVDVANSLRELQRRQMADLIALHLRREQLNLYQLRLKRFGFTGSIRCLSLEGGFSLWESYVDEAHAHVQLVGDRGIELRFEDFVSNPFQHLKSLAEFCGLNATDKSIRQACNCVQVDRAYAYQRIPELREFADQMADRLGKRGY